MSHVMGIVIVILFSFLFWFLTVTFGVIAVILFNSSFSFSLSARQLFVPEQYIALSFFLYT